MERIPTNPTTKELDDVLARILSEPTRAHLLLLGVATVLEDEQPFQTMNPAVYCDAMNAAITEHLAGLPGVVAADALMRATAAAPHVTGTAWEYAQLLRDVAKGL
ncbi:hypothetical protein [Streptomyces xantholiticus]|uniref:hypothetical protein n=1 Tax=Streptomyces xantholiticus TaxID=68285 RepID=UPI0016751B25|nr:hypothetical protein [Streptomyces xantholiticus]GGW41207.1 hypothetical protein GCM10010381_27570 [Streptomyces xantholiticus]